MWFLLAVSAFGRIMAGAAKAREIEMQRQEMLGNAARAKADAELSARIGEAEGVELALEAEQRAGTLQVQQAASGGRTDVGTNFLIRIQGAAESEWEIFKANLISRRRTTMFIEEAAAFRRQAKILKLRGKAVRQAAILGSGTSMLGGATTMGGR